MMIILEKCRRISEILAKLVYWVAKAIDIRQYPSGGNKNSAPVIKLLRIGHDPTNNEVLSECHLFKSNAKLTRAALFAASGGASCWAMGVSR